MFFLSCDAAPNPSRGRRAKRDAVGVIPRRAAEHRAVLAEATVSAKPGQSNDQRAFGPRSRVDQSGSSKEGAARWKATPELVSQDRERVGRPSRFHRPGYEYRHILRSAHWGLAAMPAPISYGPRRLPNGASLNAFLSALQSRQKRDLSVRIFASARQAEKPSPPQWTPTRCRALGPAGGDDLSVAGGEGNSALGAGPDEGVKSDPRDCSSGFGFGLRPFYRDPQFERTLVGTRHSDRFRRRSDPLLPL